VQVRGDRFDVIAHAASTAEKPRLWKLMNEVWPNYEVYQSRTTREIPVVVLTPAAS
jgi:deazaflavin-dependent oxidoreductase (nitroreductase family)